LQAHCQSHTSQRSNQSFVKELANASPRNRLSGRFKVCPRSKKQNKFVLRG